MPRYTAKVRQMLTRIKIASELINNEEHNMAEKRNEGMLPSMSQLERIMSKLESITNLSKVIIEEAKNGRGTERGE